MLITRRSGFSLIEILVTLSVLAILLALAAPSLQTLTRNNRMASVTNELVSSLNLARSEAIKRGARITVCKSANPNDTTPICSNGATWQQGWLVFVDNGVTGTVDGTDQRLRVGQPNSGNASVNPDTALANSISYLANGASTASGNFQVCLNGVARNIAISTTGRIQTTSGSCS